MFENTFKKSNPVKYW